MKKLAMILIAVLLLLPLTGRSDAAPAFTSDRNLPDAMQGVYYSTKIRASGSNPLTFSFVPGDYTAHSVPKGLTMNKEGVIYGTPQKAGTYEFVVQAEDRTIPAQATTVFYLTVKPFDEGSLRTGGTNTKVTGEGLDDLTGVANAPNGGRAAMGNGLLFFTDKKGYLMESRPPFLSATRTYRAVEYSCLDTLGNDLYYLNHYLAKKGQKAESFYISGRGRIAIPATSNQYVNRIMRDSIAEKGRVALVILKKKINNLSLTNEIALYIQDGLLKRASLTNGKETTMRAYANGRQVQADKAFPYNGYAYFTGKNDGRLYRMPLDGQVAQLLTNGRVACFTAALCGGEPVLCYADASHQLFLAGLDGASPRPLEGLKASALNADASHVYFANASDGNRVYRLTPDSEIAEKCSDTPAKCIYVFDTHIAFETQAGNGLAVLSKEGGDEALLRR